MKKLHCQIIGQELRHYRICDASAAIAVADGDYFIVANDEDNVLRVYRGKTSGKPHQEIDINHYFQNNPKNKEVDIEGAALLDGLVYWITSHGRNKEGKLRVERRNFLATKIIVVGDNVVIERVGVAYENLLSDLRENLKDQQLKKYFLGIDNKQDLAPEAPGGINIEGLSNTQDQELLIGFRNPIPDGKALLIPLQNPAQLVNQNHSTAIFGEPIQLDLGGRGIRSIEYWEKYNLYLICAGASDDGGNFCLYQWSGNITQEAQPINFDFPDDFRPESILIDSGHSDRLHILSDDGGIKQDGINECKNLPSEQRSFRSIWVEVTPT
ncbi:hypothetical protein NIES4102_13420 [Chondrocystis sp. NIES-4102]|nr:hypothetical protein NIES4102_13420 [Chondrocystis sp. NIES-4102]